MGGFSNFAVSFSIISILTGAVASYGYGLRWGGPFEMTVGWPLVTVMTLLVASSLAELASAYPTAGALYHWSSILGGPRAGWFTAWANTLGQVATTASIDFALALFVLPLLGWKNERATFLALFGALVLSHTVLNHIGIRVVAILNDLSAVYHVVGVLVIVGAAAALAPERSFALLLDRTTADAATPFGYGFLVGLLQAQWTFTGYDASAHVTEETRDPRRNAPWGMFLSVALSGVVGYALLLAVTVMIRDVGKAQAAGDDAFVYVLSDALGPRLGAGLSWICAVAMWFCGLSSVTSNSRMLFAFARDGGLPLSGAVAHVSPRFKTPDVATWVAGASAFLVGWWATDIGVVASTAVLALYVSYGLPILYGWRARRAGRFGAPGPWNLGRFSSAANLASLGWIAALLVIFVLPPNTDAGKLAAAFAVALVAYWLAGPRRSFRGPPSIVRPSTCAVGV
jgi:amino acid transporter